MDCQNFKELLDSYLCGELAVETNHTMLAHAERCCMCRNEMAARSQLRKSLRRGCSQEKMSEAAIEKLRLRLRSEAGLGAGAARASGGSGLSNGLHGRIADLFRHGGITNLFKMRFLAPVAVGAALLIGGAWSLYELRHGGGATQQEGARLSSEQLKSLELSGSLLVETAGDHRTCAPHFLNATNPIETRAEDPDPISAYDSACAKLDKIAAGGATGLTLKSAHVCNFGERRFAHLVYTRDNRLISLLVTIRDGRALKAGQVPLFDASGLGLQRVAHDHLALCAYQTVKRIVLVVSDLPESENASLAERLAPPVVEHFHHAELSSTSQSGALWIEDRISVLNLRDLSAKLIRY
jgi:hypothetical protein